MIVDFETAHYIVTDAPLRYQQALMRSTPRQRAQVLLKAWKDMQTFLPYPSYRDSAKVLDYKRLGKQRVECQQIINALCIPGAGWAKHPAVSIWRGHVYQLCLYQHCMIQEWVSRGYKNTMIVPWFRVPEGECIYTRPTLFTEEYHASHRSNLLRKDPVHYGQFGWTEPNDMEYVWR